MPRYFYVILLLGALFWNGGTATAWTQKQNVPAKTALPPLVQIVHRVHLPLYHMPHPQTQGTNNTEYIGKMFLDCKRHRLLVQVLRNYMQEYVRHDRFYWIAGGKARPCKDWNYSEQTGALRMDLIAADLNRGELYYESSSGFGNGAFLHVVSKNGEQTKSDENPAHLLTLVNGRRAGHQYRSFNDYYTDVDLGGWVGEYQDNNLLKRYDVHAAPFRLLRAENSDTILMVHHGYWQPLEGTYHRFPQVTLTQWTIESPNQQFRLVDALDMDSPGQYLYYADAEGYRLYKIRIKDGVAVATRRLPFVVYTLIVDSDAQQIHLADWKNDAVVSVKLF